MGKKAVIFAGTSISFEDAKAILDVDYLPPVRRGDLGKVAAKYDVIGIIDGIFFDRAAVGHREILEVMKKGKVVVGGCSMGALRASELDVHGMIGVGSVYGWYRDGVIEDDDEVAVLTNPDTFEPVSLPLVNIRQTFLAAQNAGLVDENECAALMKIAKSLHYSLRSYLGILKSAEKEGILDSQRAEKLLDFCKNNEVDVKREDAISVIRKIGELLNE
ncbi:TfuA-related McrA-glycine thioamidation protein [Methanohalophilus levihalophilus]|uniref:TfuA-related McrA-glycine thioamidation protein n=1 Tax=Methanohalophilus levihalophilus TaxID=1431282 RepID=UPI001AE57359|nr:TfuA-related McrA-glycine thioamidation protein [Methanohalophilus levihalophilus]